MRRLLRPSTLIAALCALGALGCGSDAGSPDSATDAPTFECDTPMSIVLSESTDPHNAGVLTAGIGWSASRCTLYADETLPDGILVIADFRGALGAELVATRAGRWAIDSSSLSSSPTTYVADLPRDMDLWFEMENAGTRIRLTIRIEGDTLILLDAQLH